MGRVVGLWNDVLEASNRPTQCLSRNRPNSSSAPELLHLANAHWARHAAESGQYHEAIQSLTYHPLPSFSISELDVVRALQSFPSGMAPGPSCPRANHLKEVEVEVVFYPSPDCSRCALNGLLGVVNLLCAGHISNCSVPHLCGASLLACQKKGGGVQVGLGILVGFETIVHSLAILLNDNSIAPESHCTLLVDFSNAFNSIDRGHMFEEARSHIPVMSSWLGCCYGSQPLLLMGEHIILSCCGVQQGDPVGPMGAIPATNH